MVFTKVYTIFLEEKDEDVSFLHSPQYIWYSTSGNHYKSFINKTTNKMLVFRFQTYLYHYQHFIPSRRNLESIGMDRVELTAKHLIVLSKVPKSLLTGWPLLTLQTKKSNSSFLFLTSSQSVSTFALIEPPFPD